MSLPRFFLDDLTGERLELRGDEARHAARARRVRIGERVVLFDGRGGEATGGVSGVERDRVEIVIESRRSIDALPSPRLTLAVAPPKGPRGDWMIEKATELGVAAVWPLRTQRGEVEPGTGRLQRWRRIALEAGKQSGRSIFLQIGETLDPPAAVARAKDFTAAWITDPNGETFDYESLIPPPQDAHPRRVAGADRTAAAAGCDDLVLVGPEGGWTDDERRALHEAGLRAIRIADGILRVETAAVAVASLWAAGRAGVAPPRE